MGKAIDSPLELVNLKPVEASLFHFFVSLVGRPIVTLNSVHGTKGAGTIGAMYAVDINGSHRLIVQNREESLNFLARGQYPVGQRDADEVEPVFLSQGSFFFDRVHIPA